MSNSVDIIRDLKEQNAKWARDLADRDPTFFPESASGQKPKVLWIGCVDSRVPESVVLGCLPGEIFTHRNIANQVFEDDPNGVSVITFAVQELGVEHIIVAGHSRCGGVAVCIADYLTNQERACCFTEKEKSTWPPRAPLDKWLQPLHDFAQSCPTIPTVEELVRYNVRNQVNKVASLPAVKASWASLPVPPGDAPHKSNLKGIHGWVYDLESGFVQDLNVSINDFSPVQPVA